MATETIGDLVDRTLRDWLIPPHQQPPRFELLEAMSDSTTTVAWGTLHLPPEATQILSPGQIIEIGQEQIIVGTVNSSPNLIYNCIRGANNTPAVAHASGSLVTISPAYSRYSVFEALSDAVQNLYPALYHLHTVTLTSNAHNFIEVPQEYISFQDVVAMHGSTPFHPAVIELRNFPPSSTGKAIIIEGGGTGLDVHLTYRSKCHVPSHENNLLLDDLGVDPSWGRILSVDAVAQLLIGRDIDQSFIKTLASRMDADGAGHLTATSIHRALLQYHEYLLERASRRLKARDGIPVSFNGRF
jgi:hypothetical protein